jgi:hypothetical protein
VLSFIAPLLEESPASLAAYAPPASKPGNAQQNGAGAAAAGEGRMDGKGGGPAAAAAGPTGASPGADSGGSQEEQQQPQEDGRGEGGRDAPGSPAAPVGPQAGPWGGAPQRPEGLIASEGESEGEEAAANPAWPGSHLVGEDGGGSSGEEAVAAARRVLGPLMPTQQQLEEAAQVSLLTLPGRELLAACIRTTACLPQWPGHGMFCGLLAFTAVALGRGRL